MLSPKLFLPLATALVLVSCAAPQTEPPAETEEDVAIQPAQVVDHQAKEKVNNLFSMSPSAHQAQQKSLANCIREQGFTWDEEINPRPFNIYALFPQSQLSLEDAKSHGYQNNSITENNNEIEQSEGAMKAYIGNPENGSVSFEGVPGAIAKDGCLAQSYQEVFGAPEIGVLFVGGILNIPLPYINATQSDSSYRDIVKEWSECMKENYQLDVKTLSSAFEDKSLDGNTMAIYDATCREEINYKERTEEILDAYMTTFLEEEAGLIDQITQAKRTAEENAPKILGG